MNNLRLPHCGFRAVEPKDGEVLPHVWQSELRGKQSRKSLDDVWNEKSDLTHDPNRTGQTLGIKRAIPFDSIKPVLG
ncbi:MAG: hypothetical protein JNL84_13935 [Candidatus Accumulibacter sp.]|nr:hypothetical protein [Accumulibacter sp.]